MFIATISLMPLAVGCKYPQDFTETLPLVEAQNRLLKSLPVSNPDLQTLHYRMDNNKASEYWVFITAALPAVDLKATPNQPTNCPAMSVFQFASSCKINQQLLEPIDVKDMGSQEGLMWEWDLSGHHWRLRTAESARGFISIVEKSR